MLKLLTPTLVITFALCLSLSKANAADSAVDLQVIHKIKDQALLHSKVMDYLHIIADENGPRLSGSPGYTRAAQLAVKAFKDDGITRASLEPWGVFGRGWSWSRIAVQMKQPHETTLTGFPADWSGATEGPVSGEVVFAPLWEEDERPQVRDLEKTARQIEVYKAKYAGKLGGKVLMRSHPAPFKLPAEPEQYRFDDEAMAELGKANTPGISPEIQWPLLKSPLDRDERDRLYDKVPLEILADQWLLDLELGNRLAKFYADEGAAAILSNGWSRTAGVIMDSDYGSFRDGDPIPPATAVLTHEHYNRLHRLLEREVPVVVEVDVDAEFHGPAIEGLNVIAEIPGKGRSDEVVMLGAHLDSWHSATGATDNASGVAVVMEAMRILKTLKLPMKRTVRAALWDAEEQGLFGSRGYVAKHFGDPISMELKSEHKKLSVYFNLDNGGGKIRGVYLQQNDAARPLLSSWLAPFADMGVTTTTITNTGSTDHRSFDAVGLPGFNFVQDPLDYDVNTHHSNVDHVDHIVPGDLMQAAAVMAATVYHAAISDEMMPRKPLPSPLPEKNPLPEILQPQ
ncbi:MAG: M20/M25/M40 family metallo-hydrolase [Halioglobus sp.]